MPWAPAFSTVWTVRFMARRKLTRPASWSAMAWAISAVGALGGGCLVRSLGGVVVLIGRDLVDGVVARGVVALGLVRHRRVLDHAGSLGRFGVFLDCVDLGFLGRRQLLALGAPAAV